MAGTRVDFASKGLVVVSGASKGIGRAIALEISRHLAPNSIVVLLARSEPGLAETKAAILEWDKTLDVITHSVDLATANCDQYERILAIDAPQVEFGIVFHNVGSTGEPLRAAALTSAPKWGAFFALNLFSVAELNSVFLRRMGQIGAKAVVVNITSLCGRAPFENLAMYGAGKAARDLFFKVLAVEEPDVIVLNYSPGPVDTDMFDGIVANAASEAVRESFRKVKEDGILQPEVTVAKMVGLLEAGDFKSGDTVDYFD